MKLTLSTNHAAQLLAEDDNAAWTRAGALALVEYLEAIEEDTGEEIEFDAVAIRCDYAEFDSLQDWAADYVAGDWREEIGADADADDDDLDEAIRDYIRDHGDLIEFDGGVIVSSF